MPEYKLIYFNVRGRAEITRWIFSYADIPFEDKRIEKEEWPELKDTIALGRLPCLMVDDQCLVQSHAIARYVAKQAGLVPKDDLKAAFCDTVVDTSFDIIMQLFDIQNMTADDMGKEKKFAESNEKMFKPALTKFEQRLSEHEWIVGDNITWADLIIGCFFGEAVILKMPSLLESYPKVIAHVKKVRSLPKIKAWIDKTQ